MARTISDNDVELFNNKLKADFDLTADTTLLKTYLANPRYISNVNGIVKSEIINKLVINFSENDAYNTIAYALQNASSISKEELQAYYSNLLNQQQISLKNTIYTHIDSYVLQIKERIKTQKPSPTANDILSNMTQAEQIAYNNFIEYFLNQHIYNDFENANNPLKAINVSCESYLNSLTPATDYQSYYNTIRNTIKSKINKDPEYKDNNAIKKRIIKLNLDVNSYITPFIDMILEASSAPNKCFIQNYGYTEVNMRPCSVYFVKEKQMCDKFEEIYRMSDLQLNTLLYLYGPNWSTYSKPNATSTFDIYIFDKKFVDIINTAEKRRIFNGNIVRYDENNAHIKGVFDAFRKELQIIYRISHNGMMMESVTSAYSTELIKKIIKDMYTKTIRYNNKTYNYLALHRIRQQKINNNGKQLCKIQIPELTEIGSEDTYKYTYDFKVQGTPNIHINPPELWGSCFYNLQSNQLDDASRQNIQDSMKSKYNISPSCDNHMIDNLKCNTGCGRNNNNKFMAFDASTFSYETASVKLNETISISSDLVFLKIKHKIRLLGSADPVDVNFVSFNNVTKTFNNVSNITSLNPMIKEKLFTIKNTRNRLSLEPNISKKSAYVCNFYNNILYEYSTQQIDFSLNDLSDVTLKKILPDRKLYSEISMGIRVLSYISSRFPFSKKCLENSTYGVDFNETKNCMNEIKDFLNNVTLNNLNITLNQYKEEKSHYERIIGQINQQITYSEQDFQTSCNTPAIIQQRSTYEILVETYKIKINAINNERIELRNELTKWENWKPDWWKPWEWIHKVRMTNDTKRFLWEKDQEWGVKVDEKNDYVRKLAVINNKCNTISKQIQQHRDTKTENENVITRNISPKITDAEGNITRYNRQDPDFYYQNMETYDINNLDVASDIVNLQTRLSFDFFWKYIVLMYNNKFLTSNDDCIYIQIN
jgi:hypothetical protein